MKYVLLLLSWFFSILFGLLAISMVLVGNPIRAILLLGVVLLLLPPVRFLIHNQTGLSLSLPVRAIVFVALLAGFVWLTSIDKPTSIYASPEIEANLMSIYDARLEEWPVPYESIYLDTAYGKVHVIASGPQDAPPALLLHASGLSAWSWLYNVEDLNQHYRTYAIDTIGDAGKSALSDLENFPQDGPALADLYTDISNQLGAEHAYVVGASQGGFIGTNYALYAPERVEKLVLLGPMGYTGTNSTVFRIILVSFFPLKPLQEDTVRWAIGDDPGVLEACGEWFWTLLDGVMSKQARPQTFAPEQLQTLEVPVLLVLGQKDNLVGDPEKARELAQNIPDVQVEVLDAAHAIGVEQPEQVNALIDEFFGQE
jgi:pimeloyl-ACP methyl ester carboxylesterase